MGYYTYFKLEVTGDSPNLEAIAEKLSGISDYLFEVYDGEIVSGDCYKWYDFDAHMIKLAKAYPKFTFCLRGEGEESGDIWRSYYRGRKKPVRQHVELRFPDPPDWVAK